MKKSIAFLGALLFGSVTFAQVNKNDTINKTGSRKVSAEDLKKLPPETETTEKSSIYMKISDIKGERGISTEKHSSDASAGTGSKIKGSVTQKMNVSESAKTTEKQHYTIKMNNAAKVANDSVAPKTKSTDIHLKMPNKKKE
ncbi:hypothetical protein [Flavobacterium sp.]|uniref:hypothetical protein n=1 Tax=Flavobacterium sp. TaxID=239 RepID=UPI00286AA629|nr:hypothetical protein [Flavobacterium sp.]